MNHLTNHYKHKCEQLQEQINNIKRMLNEVNAPPDGGLPPMQMPTGWDLVGPRSPNGIPTGFPGSDQYGPPSPYDFSDAPKMPTGNDPVEWNRWLDRMWQWYINNYPYNLTDNSNSGYWWKIWEDIQKLAPGGSEWDWQTQPSNPNGPYYTPLKPGKPNNTPVIPTGVPPKPERPSNPWPPGFDPDNLPKPSKYPSQQMPPNWLPQTDPLRRNPAHNDTWWETWFGR